MALIIRQELMDALSDICTIFSFYGSQELNGLQNPQIVLQVQDFILTHFSLKTPKMVTGK